MLRARGETQVRPCANVAATTGRPWVGSFVVHGTIEIRRGIDVVPPREQCDRQPVRSRDVERPLEHCWRAPGNGLKQFGMGPPKTDQIITAVLGRTEHQRVRLLHQGVQGIVQISDGKRRQVRSDERHA